MAALLVVVAVVGVFLGTRTRKPAASVAPGGPELVFRAEPAADVRGVSGEAVTRAAALLQTLTGSLPGEHGAVSVTRSGDRVVVHVGRATPVTRLRILSLAGVTGRLGFYDWEANALTPAGKSVASGLARQDPSALQISQGSGTLAPGSVGAGSVSLSNAVRLAAEQPLHASANNGRPGAQYFAFGGPGSSACAAAARYYGTRLAPGTRCYLAGPAPSADLLTALLPPGAAPGLAETLTVPAGTVVLQAVPSGGFARGSTLADPTAQFYVLRDHPGIPSTGVTNPRPGADASGSPGVTFGFTSRGARAFSQMTAQVSHRGDLVSGLGETLDQHFAVALGDQLVTVPSIDFKTYPDGIPGNEGADITGGFTRRSSQTAVLEVRLGSLPIVLRLVEAS
ncbi:MAG TPA: hypothetical protein VMD09_00425 [Solirubrobacteraceae bacterium]|nr:hypothetical protein [Solirubrobacteraceae bacterium]